MSGLTMSNWGYLKYNMETIARKALRGIVRFKRQYLS